MLPRVDWDSLTNLQDGNATYNTVLEIFSGFYDIAFSKQKIKIKNKTLKNPWK